jgi:hypothetical protein
MINKHTLYPIALLLVIKSRLFLLDLYGKVVDSDRWHHIASQFGVQFHVSVTDRATPYQGKHHQNPTINQRQYEAILSVNH